MFPFDEELIESIVLAVTIMYITGAVIITGLAYFLYSKFRR